MRLSTKQTVLRLALLLIVLFGAVWVVLNRQKVVDMITVWRYNPSSSVLALADRSGMSDNGRFMFYASRPLVASKDQFNANCQKMIEKTAILGCYTKKQIFVYDITDPRLDGIREVTASHEMLHAVYDRMSPNEKKRIDSLVEQETKNLTDQKLQERLALYDKTELGERNNELHSIIATEINQISPDLEKHYAQYFKDRQAVVKLSESYARVFREIENEQNRLVTEITELAGRIETAVASYKQEVVALSEAIDRFNERARNGQFSSQSAFDAERRRLTREQNLLASVREQINDDISAYNQKKTELLAVNERAQEIQSSINSTALPEAPSLQ